MARLRGSGRVLISSLLKLNDGVTLGKVDVEGLFAGSRDLEVGDRPSGDELYGVVEVAVGTVECDLTWLTGLREAVDGGGGCAQVATWI
jgi:hypothetical protein